MSNRQRVFENLRLDRVHVGASVAEATLAEAESRGATRVAIVASGSLTRNSQVISDLKGALGTRFAGQFDGLVEHVPREAVLSLAGFLRETSADLIVTVGGGTPIDTVKTALVCLAEGLTDSDQLEAFAISTAADGSRTNPSVGTPPLRQIAAPTTLSGAEFSDLAGCVDVATHRKQLFTGNQIGPAAVILDPSITVHTPMRLWLSTGVRALDHAVETLCSSAPEPFADAGALHAIRLLGRSLPATLADPADLHARLESQQAVWMACTGLNRVPYGASHGLGHQLGAVSGMPHGDTSCVMMPHIMAFNADVTGEAQEAIAIALGRPDQLASATMTELIVALGLPTRLRDAGVAEEHLAVIAEESINHPWVAGNVRPFESVNQLLTVLQEAY